MPNIDAFVPPPRLLMGPGPISCDPRVLRAMSHQLIGQFDPSMTHCMNETMGLYRGVFRTENRWTFLVDSTARGGIEAALVSLLKPGDRVLVPVFGRFGFLLKEIAERCDAEVHCIEIEWGRVAEPEQIAQAIDRVKPQLVALVQGDTSTTMCQPLAEIGRLCREKGVLTYCDATASIGGNTFLTDEWDISAVSAGLQKCLGGPSGIAPITLNEEAVARIDRRRHIEAGIRASHHVDAAGERIRSNYFDLAMIMDYWGEERLNHHTEATSMLFAARECARIWLEEGAEKAIARHRQNGEAMAAGLQAMGLKLFGDQHYRMNNVVGVYIPEGADGEKIRAQLLEDFAIEIGTSFGPLHGRIWRIGTMGYNARRDAVLQTLACLEQVLKLNGVKIQTGDAVPAALDSLGPPGAPSPSSASGPQARQKHRRQE
ncbi:pyridoxal-phosphate-dependent aminotransferase family protein [Microbulbifer rhizosphaerae]|uniref:(S)-ureidoglycine-glyoxylate aminotransferase n=1 Tax=Microbulbifer rhizosphaerae TaxID=1562603 RepID=A0A7W4WEQ1_9GAMM|nr:alanine--glyoxylate aminotransferase family protein [Microbulbifer rhizosphaerae]MBB3062880.1 (S)-ureidoglycine-glyoxylate aminotransferase [Microbulbifer rhizosphaerae]